MKKIGPEYHLGSESANTEESYIEGINDHISTVTFEKLRRSNHNRSLIVQLNI